MKTHFNFDINAFLKNEHIEPHIKLNVLCLHRLENIAANRKTISVLFKQITDFKELSLTSLYTLTVLFKDLNKNREITKAIKEKFEDAKEAEIFLKDLKNIYGKASRIIAVDFYSKYKLSK